jgi:hypothetical protein
LSQSQMVWFLTGTNYSITGPVFEWAH